VQRKAQPSYALERRSF